MKRELKLLVVQQDDRDYAHLKQLLEESKRCTFHITRSQSLSNSALCTDGPDAAVDAALVYLPPGTSPKFHLQTLAARIPSILLIEKENEELESNLIKKGVQDVLVKDEVTPLILEKSLLYAIERHELLGHFNRYGQDDTANENPYIQQHDRLLIDYIGEGIGFVDKNERFIFANTAAKSIFGVPGGGLGGRLLNDFLAPRQLETVKQQTGLRQTGEKTTYELDIITPAGDTRTLQVTGNPWFDDDGNYIGSFGIFRDITDQVESKRFMLLLKKALNTMQVGVTITNLKREIIYINPAEAHMHGYTVEEMEHSESRIFGLKKNWKPLTIEDVKRMESWEREGVNKRKDGTIFPVHLISDVVKDEKGEPFGIVTCCMDITYRKESEQALQASTQYLRGILESQLDLVIRLDAGGRFTYANDAYCKCFGKTRQELLGHTFIPEIHEEDLKENRNAHKALETPPYRVFYQQRTLTVDGWKWLSWQGYAIRDNEGNLIEIQSVGRDVTEQKEMEEELRLYATTDTMTGVQNRRVGLLMLEKKMQMGKRSKSPLVVCFVDINNLKAVNDQFGHSEGDDLIRVVSQLLQEALRQSDTICRLGGDEFLLIFPNCSLMEAQKIWERILEKSMKLNRECAKPYPITFSHGFAEHLPGSKVSVEELVGMADKEMYKEKQRLKPKDDIESSAGSFYL